MLLVLVGPAPIVAGVGVFELSNILRGVTMLPRGLLTDVLIANTADNMEGSRLASEEWFGTNIDKAYVNLCTVTGATIMVGGFAGRGIGKMDSSIFTAVGEKNPGKVSKLWTCWQNYL